MTQPATRLVQLLRSVEQADRQQRFERHAKQAHDLGVPRHPLILRLEVTNRCNANCVFCAYQYQSRPVTVMSDEVFQRAVDQFTALGGQAINFSPVVGEALIDKHLEEKVAYVRRHPQYVKLELFTNGILLSRQRFEALVGAGISHFHLAMSGFDEAEYERVYRNKHYARLLNNLFEIAESPALGTISFVIYSRTDSLTPESMPDYRRIQRLGVYHIEFAPQVVSWHGAIEQEDLPNQMFLINGPRDQSKPCFMLWGGQAVLADGRMTLCGCSDVNGDGLPLGNVLETDIDAHLRDGRWERWRDDFREGNPPAFCRGCDQYWPHA